MSVSIVLADDHPVVRHGLRGLLESQRDWVVVGEARNGLEAVEQVGRLKPNVLVADLMMPEIDGLEVTRRVGELSPQTSVIILSMHANEAYVLEAMRAGAVGYVLKDSSAEELTQAVRQVLAGNHFLSACLSERAILVYLQKAESSAAREPYDLLTPRERQVLRMAAEGLNHSEIGRRLSISPRTAESHRTSLMRKLGFHSQTDLIRFALEKGILPKE
jgi:two-component system, NarL family, response regulator NreC